MKQLGIMLEDQETGSWTCKGSRVLDASGIRYGMSQAWERFSSKSGLIHGSFSNVSMFESQD